MRTDYMWKNGLEFTSIKQFKEVVREYNLLNGYDVRFRSNDSSRYKVKCRSE